MAPPKVARDVLGDHAEDLRGALLVGDQRAGLGQIQEADQRVLYAIEGVLAVAALGTRHGHEAHAMAVHHPRHPAKNG